MKKIAVIKIGATGDVVRTTTLLHLFKDDEIHWVTAKKNVEVLPDHGGKLKKIAIEDIGASDPIFDEEFDAVISLDDDRQCAELAGKLKSKKIFGIYLKGDKILYTEDSNQWFDMGLSSRFGKAKADELKWENRESYQKMLFEMLGFDFKGEPYILPPMPEVKKDKIIIGMENRAGKRWPTKLWNKYDELEKYLKGKGFDVVRFEDKENMREYFADINKVSYMVCGDTLGMHIALGLNIPTVAIFTCTSPYEIYDYGIMQKVISGNLGQAFYKTEYIPEAIDCISVEDVVTALGKTGLRV